MGFWGGRSCRANQTFHASQARTHAMGLASRQEIDGDPAAFSLQVLCSFNTTRMRGGAACLTTTGFVPGEKITQQIKNQDWMLGARLGHEILHIF